MARLTERPLNQIAEWNSGLQKWVAGPKAPEGYQTGQIIPNEDFQNPIETATGLDNIPRLKDGKQDPSLPPGGDIGRAMSMRKYWNDIARVRRSEKIDGLDEAREQVRNYREWKAQLRSGEISESEFRDRIQDSIGSP